MQWTYFVIEACECCDEQALEYLGVGPGTASTPLEPKHEPMSNREGYVDALRA